MKFSTLNFEMFATKVKLRKHLPKCLRCIVIYTGVPVKQPSKFLGTKECLHKRHTDFERCSAPFGFVM